MARGLGTSQRRTAIRGSEVLPQAPISGMDDRRAPMNPDEAERRFAAMLEEAGLPRFASSFHDPATGELQLAWGHGFCIRIAPTCPDMEPIDDRERAAILGQAPDREDSRVIHVLVPGCADAPRAAAAIPGVVIHRGPPL